MLDRSSFGFSETYVPLETVWFCCCVNSDTFVYGESPCTRHSSTERNPLLKRTSTETSTILKCRPTEASSHGDVLLQQMFWPLMRGNHYTHLNSYTNANAFKNLCFVQHTAGVIDWNLRTLFLNFRGTTSSHETPP